MPSQVHRWAAWAFAGAWAALLGGAACAGGSTEPRPVPTLASTPQAGVAFDEIRSAWRDPGESPAPLRQLLDRFIARFATDGLVPLGRVYLALVAMDLGDFASADAQLAATRDLPPGTTRDLWTVARARRLRLRGDPEGALAILRPLVGKNVDPLTQGVFEQELTLTALATHRDYEAISYMDAWVRASSEDDRRRTLSTVAGLVERLPTDVLMGALQAMRTQRATLGYGIEIARILARRLARIATESGDAELARMLLDPDAGAIVVGGEAGVELSELATSRRGINVVAGRTLGLLLPTESPGLRDESADVLRGVMWALGLPRGLRGPSTVRPTLPRSSLPRSSAARTGCAPGEGAPPPLEDPGPDEGLRLVTRDDAGTADRTEVSLDELAGEGAGLVIAGFDPQTAARAVRWGEDHHVAVVVLVPPARGDGPVGFGFVLGEPRDTVVDALARAAPIIASERVVPVIDASEVTSYPPQGGRFGALTLLPPISCDTPATRAGEPRFPVTEWAHDKTQAWLVSGSPSCANDVTAELSAARARGVVALTLEAAGLPAHGPGLRVVSASAGVLPQGAADDGGDELQRFSTTLGALSWWTALGRDAATLGRAALQGLPLDTANDPAAVAERRAHARDLLATARAPLWTTESTSWTRGHTMKRTICAVEAPAR